MASGGTLDGVHVGTVEYVRWKHSLPMTWATFGEMPYEVGCIFEHVMNHVNQDVVPPADTGPRDRFMELSDRLQRNIHAQMGME